MRNKKQLRNIKIVASVVTLIVLVFSLSYYFYHKKHRQASTFDNSKYFVKGIDVSHHNPILDWTEVRNQNISFVYIKATEGITHDDRNYRSNYKLSKENNIKVGAYHFYSFGISGREQAKHFINVAKCKSGDLFPAIDVEHSFSNIYSKDTIYTRNLLKELSVLEKELYEHYGFHPIIYTNMDCYKLYIKDRFPDNYIWICDLRSEPSDHNVQNWIIWQFTHKGELPGIVGDVDFNYFRYSFDRLNEITIP